MYETIVDQIYEAIMRGDLNHNDKLPCEHKLCEMFGVSRVTVREAVRALEQYGIVEVRQGSLGGAYIKNISLDDITDQVTKIIGMTNITFSNLSEARLGIECAALKQLKNRKLNQKELADLENNILAVENFAKQGNSRERLRANFDFHLKLVALSKNPIYSVMHNAIVHLSYKFFEKVQASELMIQKTINEHRKILNYIKKNDINEACEICEKHIRDVGKRIIEKSKKQSKLK